MLLGSAHSYPVEVAALCGLAQLENKVHVGVACVSRLSLRKKTLHTIAAAHVRLDLIAHLRQSESVVVRQIPHQRHRSVGRALL